MSETTDILDQNIDNTLPDVEAYDTFDINAKESDLLNTLVRELDDNRTFWNKKPWNLQETDKRNINYLLGAQDDQDITVIIDGEEFTNNRLFTSVRSILSYATGQVAQPEIGPSSSDDVQKKAARGLGMALYEHSVNEDADDLFRVALLSLITRKRAYIKLRYDDELDDIVSEYVPPEDIVEDRYAGYNKDPNVRYQRIRCTINELVAKFPDKQPQIYAHYGIQRGVYTQVSKMIVYYEAWFTYVEQPEGKPAYKAQGVAWFLPNANFILDKQKNPNWIYKGTLKDQHKINVMKRPPKPYVNFNYFNLGNRIIDETCLFDQAVPLQKLINKRIKQITDNADYVNGRWVMSKKVNEDDANAFINKGTNTTLMVDTEDVNKAVVNISSSQLPSYVYQSLIDARNELDTVMGTPSQFRGETPSSQDTLGRDQMVKQQAGMLQDDLVRAINKAYKKYYTLKLQLMLVNYGEDHKFSQKGGNGDYNFFVVNEDSIDPKVKVDVQIDSTLPLDKTSIRATALNLARLNRIDSLSLFEDLGMPDPEIRAERLSRSMLDPAGYMQSVSTDMENSDAELDITLVSAGKTPEERSVYDLPYLNYWNAFMTTNRFSMLPQDAKQRLVIYLQFIQQKAQAMADLQATQTDDAGMLEFIPQPKQPNISITGALDPAEAAQVAGVQPQQPAGPPAPGAAGPLPPEAQPPPTNVNPIS